MSHFTVAVFHKENQSIDSLLAPYYEGLQVFCITTKEEHIAKSREKVRNYEKGLYTEYLKDPYKYTKECQNEGLIKYLKKEFPLKLKWTDNQHYKDSIQYYDDDQINPDGSTNETYNPKSKWDWFQVGGRWQGMLQPKKGTTTYSVGEQSWNNSDKIITGVDSLLVKDIDFKAMEIADKARGLKYYNEDIARFKETGNKGFRYFDFSKSFEEQYKYLGFSTYAVIKDGKWYESGISSNEKDNWEEEFQNLLNSVDENLYITILDCHI